MESVNTHVGELVTRKCWRSFASSAHACIGEMLGRELELLSDRPSTFTARNAAMVTLSLPLAEVELRLAVEIEGTCLEAIGTDLLGDVFEEGLVDIVNELANTVGGAVMRVALAEQIELTTSLPTPVDSARLLVMQTDFDATRECWIRDCRSNGVIAMSLGIRTRRNIVVRVNALREGMVLARDLLTAAGALLLRAGTRMTSSSTERIAKALGGDFPVEIAETA